MPPSGGSRCSESDSGRASFSSFRFRMSADAKPVASPPSRRRFGETRRTRRSRAPSNGRQNGPVLRAARFALLRVAGEPPSSKRLWRVKPVLACQGEETSALWRGGAQPGIRTLGEDGDVTGAEYVTGLDSAADGGNGIVAPILLGLPRWFRSASKLRFPVSRHTFFPSDNAARFKAATLFAPVSINAALAGWSKV